MQQKRTESSSQGGTNRSPSPPVGIFHHWKKKPLQYKGQHRGLGELMPSLQRRSKTPGLGHGESVLPGGGGQ